MMKARGAASGERHPPGPSGARLAGFTLVEVLVVIAILGLIFGVTGLAFTSLRAPRDSAWVTALRQARAAAILSGRPTRAVLAGGTVAYPSPLPGPFQRRSPLTAPLFLPDGRAVGSGADPLTGGPLDAPK